VSRALFISDLHLTVERPASNKKFFSFLRAEAARAQSLYILGDLFEHWIGDDELGDADSDRLGAEVAEGLRALTAAGVAVALMHGNRDFLIGQRFCEESGAAMLADPTVAEINAGRVLLMHGDTLCTDDHEYLALRATVRSDAWQREILGKSVSARRQIAAGLRADSKSANQAKAAEIMDVNQRAVEEAFRIHGVKLMIHGHTHRPARHVLEVDGRACERWVLPDWYGRGGYLALDAVGPRLVSF
jgi:UDP-2,3-diacylglucosamine hydrolase